MPTAPSAIATATTISPMRIIFTSSTCTDGVRSLERLMRLSAKLAAILVSHTATITSAPSLDQQQRRQPQVAKHDGVGIECIDRRIELAEDG